MSFKNYKENFLLEEGKEKDVRVLIPQHFSFFKNISNLSINETIRFKLKIDKSDFHTDRFFIKYFESDNFENLVNYFPSNRQDFDSEIGSFDRGGEYEYKIKKIYNSQKGILFGIFIDGYNLYWKLEPTNIHISAVIGEEEKEKSDCKSDNEENNEKKDDSLGVGSVVAIIISIVIFIFIMIFCCKNCFCNDDQRLFRFRFTFISEGKYYINWQIIKSVPDFQNSRKIPEFGNFKIYIKFL